MKNKTIVKIISIAAAIAALSATVFAVSAQETEQTKPEIFSQNVYYSDKFSLMYAVDADTVTGNTVTLTVTGGEAAWTQTIDATEANLQTVKGKPAYVFITKGVGPQDFATQYSVTVTSGDATSAVKTYSIAEYLGERLYKNGIAVPGADETRKAFYLSTLEFAANAGKVLNIDSDPNNNVEHLVTDYYYVYTDLGAVDGKSAGVYLGGTSHTFTPTDTTKKYQISYLDENGSVTSSEAITDGSFTLKGNAVIELKSYARGEGKYWNEKGSSLTDGYLAFDFNSEGGSLNGFGGNVSGGTTFATGSNVDGAATLTRVADTWATAHFYYNRIDSEFPGDVTDATCKVFEFDYKLSHMFSGTNDGRSLFRLDGGDYVKAYRNSDGTTLSLGEKDKTVITPGEWCNIRFEFYNVDGAKYVQIYVNDTYAYTQTLTDAEHTFNNRIYFYLESATSVGTTVCVDNFIMAFIEKNYVENP